MKKILIYGDSNTWGDNFCTGIRIPDDKQWVNILRKKLGDNFVIFQEGLPGRLAGNEEKERQAAPPMRVVTKDLHVVVNNEPVTLHGKSDYIFVDIFDS